MSEQLEGQLNDYAPFRHEAKTMNVLEFSEAHKAPIRLWGKPPKYNCVDIGKTSYLWRLKDGEYHGWDRNLNDPS